MAVKASILRRVGNAIAGLFCPRESEQMRHEREMANLDALKSGKITPSYAMRYAGVGVFVVLSLFIIAEACFPDLIPGSPVEALEHLGELGVNMLKAIFGM